RVRPRESRAQDPIPAHGDTARDRAARVLQPTAQPDRRVPIRADIRRHTNAQLAGAAADPDAAGGVLNRSCDAACGAVRALSRYLPDLGSGQPDRLLRLAGDHPAVEGARSAALSET